MLENITLYLQTGTAWKTAPQCVKSSYWLQFQQQNNECSHHSSLWRYTKHDKLAKKFNTNWFHKYGQHHHMPYQPSNHSSFSLSFLGLILSPPVLAGLALSLSQGRPLWKLEGLTSSSMQIKFTHRNAGQNPEIKTKNTHTTPKNRCTHAPTPPTV